MHVNINVDVDVEIDVDEGQNFKRPKNQKDSCNFDDSWTKSIAPTRSIFAKMFAPSKKFSHRRKSIRTLERKFCVDITQNASLVLDIDAASVSFEDNVNIRDGSTMSIEGAIDILGFPGSLAVTNSSAVITSAEENSIGVALGTTWYAIDPTTNQGSASFHSVGLLGTDGVTRFGSVEGTLPGDLTVDLNGLQPGGEGGELEQQMLCTGSAQGDAEADAMVVIAEYATQAQATLVLEALEGKATCTCILCSL